MQSRVESQTNDPLDPITVIDNLLKSNNSPLSNPDRRWSTRMVSRLKLDEALNSPFEVEVKEEEVYQEGMEVSEEEVEVEVDEAQQMASMEEERMVIDLARHRESTVRKVNHRNKPRRRLSSRASTRVCSPTDRSLRLSVEADNEHRTANSFGGR